MDNIKKPNYEGVLRGEFEAFCQLMHLLRQPEGCPWDRAQDFQSLKSCMIDEMSEAIAGINILTETGDADNLCEELGDVLMHIVLLADMAQEQGKFSLEDVIAGIGSKMLRRHPHVFGEDSRKGWEPGLLSDIDELPHDWAGIKKLEKQKKSEEQKQQEKAATEKAKEEMIEYYCSGANVPRGVLHSKTRGLQ